MKHTGTIDLPLHYGKCPRWLFQYMSKLSALLVEVIVYEYGPHELLRRLSDPYFFQSFGCVLGFDWHSSGLTTTVCGALKDGLKGKENDLGIFVAGGKGATSRKTPAQIQEFLESSPWGINPEPLIYSSRMVAKVDNTAVQDGYQLYHHNFMFDSSGHWTVIQQGMHGASPYARRYHWWSENVESFVIEPHKAVCGKPQKSILNMVARESLPAQQVSVDLSKENPVSTVKELNMLKASKLPLHHQVLLEDINPLHLQKILYKTREQNPKDFERLLGIQGVGPKTIRALALISELIYGKPPSHKDPVNFTQPMYTGAGFSFAHGGKDGHPYPVDRVRYQESIDILAMAVKEAKLGYSERLKALKRLRLS